LAEGAMVTPTGSAESKNNDIRVNCILGQSTTLQVKKPSENNHKSCVRALSSH
jgi:hypothetical protein